MKNDAYDEIRTSTRSINKIKFEISVGEKIIEVWTRQIKISEDLTNKQHNFRSTLLRISAIRTKEINSFFFNIKNE
ncbi:unnamed protein product [Rhizophagus irregularis]|nr:unnamed protein product [Rhizophagus irregularis]CAB5354217.1 unnamed protein product [Rhizophagus irregularis]